MLIVLPPSETKRPPPDDGPPVDPERLSFPELTPMRMHVLDALVATSAETDALRRLRVSPRMAHEAMRNERLRELPTRRAIDTYAGPLYEGLDPESWSDEVARGAAQQLVIVSALWGALRPDDAIPPYRLHVCARLIGQERLEPMWRTMLPGVLTDASGGAGPIVDLRSPVYQAVGRPAGLDDQTVILRVRPSAGGPPHIGDVVAKRVRGEAARRLLSSSAEPEEVLDVADELAAQWPIELEPPGGRNRSWTITLQAP
jgi:uncharacterized protein